MFDKVRKFFSTIANQIRTLTEHKKSEIGEEVLIKNDQPRRMCLVLSQLELVRMKPQVRLLKVENIFDVLRFMLRLCDVEHVDCKMIGGCMRCVVRLPENAGTLSLTEKKADNSCRILAILNIDVPLMNPQVEEVVFKLKQH